MSNRKTKAGMMWLIITKIASEFSRIKQIPLEQANKIIYKSQLYKMLENEENKMWYFSFRDLTDFLIEEYEVGTFDLSDYV